MQSYLCWSRFERAWYDQDHRGELEMESSNFLPNSTFRQNLAQKSPILPSELCNTNLQI